MDFSANLDSGGGLTVAWYRGGQVVGQENSFTFVPQSVGKDTLQVKAFATAASDTYYWVIEVLEEVSVIPPAVSNVEVSPGIQPSDVLVKWNRVTGAAFPLVEYIVRISYDGPITEGNWDQASELGRYSATGTAIGYSKTYTAAADGMLAGERAWFAVRALDDRQQLSLLPESYYVDITRPWYLGGRVTDDAGKPLLGVIVVSTGPGYSANTDGTGRFLFDKPFRDIDSIRVATSSPSLYDFATEPVTIQGDTTFIDVTLINEYGLGYPGCYADDFLVYLQALTLNQPVPGQPGKSRLFTWEQYPVSVYIPEFVNPNTGVDMTAATLDAMEYWNTAMRIDAAGAGISETDYFVRTADEASAAIVVLFEFRSQNYGLVSLLQPSGSGIEIGEVVPQKMEVWINTDVALDLDKEVRGVALHEFGHTLGMLGHAECSGAEYLMISAGGTSSLSWLEPIHQDERRAVRAIRNIPQGSIMADYSRDGTDLK